MSVKMGCIAMLVVLGMPWQATPQTGKLSDLAWMAGRWTGAIPEGQVEETWSAPESGLMVGMFRLFTAERTLVLEFMSLRETAAGVEMRLRHFTPELRPLEKDDAITLRYTGLTGDTHTFENPVHSRPKNLTLRREGQDAFLGRSEIIRDDGSRNVIEVRLRRDPLPPTRKAARAHRAWQQGPEWDRACYFFERGNAFAPRKLQERFEAGPIQWLAAPRQHRRRLSWPDCEFS